MLINVIGEQKMTLDERIPEAMKDIGFTVVKSGGADTILLPALEVVPWHANKWGAPGEGRYKRIAFDEDSNTAHLETEDGEISDITIDSHNGVVRTRTVADGNEKHNTLTYEKDPRAIFWVNRHLDSVKGISIDYDSQTSVLTVKKEGREIYSEKVNVPEGVKIEVKPFKSFLRVTDQGRKFSKTYGSGWCDIPKSYESDHFLVGLNPEALKEGKVVFEYFLSNKGPGAGLEASSGTIPEAIDDLMKETYFNELHEGASSIDVAGKPLTVFGPNRKGDYRLSSGKSSVIYSPGTGELRYSGGSMPYISTTVSGRLEDGELMLRDVFTPQSGGGHKVWKVTLNFGNTDPRKSYTAELIEDTTPKSEWKMPENIEFHFFKKRQTW